MSSKAGIRQLESVTIPIVPPAHPDALRFALHGGALDAARHLYPEAPTPWIDLSTGINPWPYPLPAFDPAFWTRLPEQSSLTALEAEAARLYRCPGHIRPVAAPGTQAIIQRLPALLGGSDVRIFGPTYGEFARVFAGSRTVMAPGDLVGADVAVVVNPNNPDGRLLAPDTLVGLAARVGALIVDEAFMDALEPRNSVMALHPGGRVVVLRSFGKFYGLAGLRLGFALATPDLAEALRAALGPWALSGPAVAIGIAALGDAAWARANRARLGEEAARLDAVLGQTGFTLIGGTPLFRLAQHRQAPALFEGLAEAGILTRPFADAPDRLRFGLPATHDAWRRLTQALAYLARSHTKPNPCFRV